MTDVSSFLASDLAVGWLSVALASGQDEELPVLNKTILIEQYASGIRLSSTDRYVLLHSWVAAQNDRWAAEPALDEAPAQSAVAIDANGRGGSLLKFLLKLAKNAEKDELPPPMASLTLNVPDEDDLPEPSFAGMEKEYVVIEHPDHEFVKLRTFGGEYPDWRPLHAGFAPKTTREVALNPNVLERLAKLGALHGGKALLWRFGGPEKAASLEIADADPPVRGLVMPVRWLSAELEDSEAA